MQLLKGKTALITGGTAGIGKAIAKLFVEQGANVVIWGTNRPRGEEVLLELGTAQKTLLQIVDVAKTQEVDVAIAEAIAAMGKFDILVNNAGIVRDQLLMKMKEEDWDLVLDINLKSVYNTCHALCRPMMKAQGGSIINITSVIGLTGNAGQTNYAASKAGMIGFTKSLAKELASRNVRANCIAPGYIKTKMTEDLPISVQEAVLAKVPLGRMGEPSDIAQAALFLASDLSGYITGQVLTVDGGMVI